jgi:aminocarboxymuconate-semialdehyde decarboxylase
MILDVHSHHIPQRILSLLREGRAFPMIGLRESSESFSFAFPDLAVSPPAPRAIADTGVALSWMDEQGVDVQVLGPWTDLFGYTLDASDADLWCRTMNESLAETADTSDRFWAMGAVALQDPQLATAHVQQIVALGMAGIMIGTDVPDGFLDDDRYADFWSAVAASGLPVLMHPIFLEKERIADPTGMRNAVYRALATTATVSRLLLSGTLVDYPGVRLIVSHGGAGVPALLGRLQRNHELRPEATADPSEGFARLFFDSVVIDPRALEALVQFTSPAQVLLGSDRPFPWVEDIGGVVRNSRLPANVQKQILEGNGSALFGASHSMSEVG